MREEKSKCLEVSSRENPFLLKKNKKPVYIQGELFPMEKESLIDKTKKWWNSLSIRPYFEVRDFNNGPDTNKENPSKSGYEIGIRFSF